MNTITDQMSTQNVFYDFLEKYATDDDLTKFEDIIDEYYNTPNMLEHMDMLIEQIMQRIKT
jgi:hypothetical protein